MNKYLISGLLLNPILATKGYIPIELTSPRTKLLPHSGIRFDLVKDVPSFWVKNEFTILLSTSQHTFGFMFS